MNNRFLGTLALMGAPCLLIGNIVEKTYPQLAGGWFYGVYGFIYITGWMCSMEVFRRIKATGHSRFGKYILRVILGTLFLANVSNVYAFFSPQDRSLPMLILDSFWPISNLIMLIVGITVMVSKGLPGWQRFVPLIAGLWLPFALTTRTLLSGVSLPFNIVFVYSTIAWSLLAIVSIIHTKKSDTSTTIKRLQIS
jgi:hypothetical protein